MFQNVKKRLKDQRGLTLVELLAVIVILGIIAAIAVPSIGGIINKTKEDAKVAEAVQIISSAKLYITTKPNATTITSTQLEPYLDKVKDSSFQVNVTKDANGKHVYELENHDSAPIVTGGTTTTKISETELLGYSGN